MFAHKGQFRKAVGLRQCVAQSNRFCFSRRRPTARTTRIGPLHCYMINKEDSGHDTRIVTAEVVRGTANLKLTRVC